MFISRTMANASDDRSPWGDFWFTPVGTRAATGMRLTPDSALHLPAVLACVRVLSESFAVLPLKLYQNGSDGKRKRLNKHWLLDLMRRPNPFQTAFEWKEMMEGHLALRGNAYNEIQTDRSGRITALMPMHPDRIEIQWLSGKGDFNYRYLYTDKQGNKIPFARDEVWHLRGLSSDGVSGLSPIGLAREAAALGLSAQDYGARFFQNDATPGGGWIEFPGKFKDKPARDQFRESWQEAHGALNRHKIAVLEYGMKFHQLGLNNKDSQFLEARQFQVSEIARIFRVPPHLIGDLSKATFSNIEQQSLDFVLHTMTPIAERWESSIEAHLLLDSEGDIDPEFDMKRLLRGDQASRSSYYGQGIQNGWLTRNEAREDDGREPIDGLDEPLRPLNMVEESAANNPPAGPTPPQHAAPAPDNEDTEARLAAILRGNAGRLARRIAGGGAVSAEVLADALAIPLDRAAAWLAAAKGNEAELTEQLLEIAR